MKSELRAGEIADERGDDRRNLFGAGAAVGIADDDAADFLLDALFDEAVKVVEAALGKIAAAGIAIFTAAATGIHGVLEIDEDFKAVLLQKIDGLAHHEQIFFESGFERALHVEQTRLDDDHGGGDAVLVADDELDIRPILDFRTAAARTPEECEAHGAGVDGFESRGQIGDELVSSGKADLRVAHAESRHALQEQNGIGHRDFELRLLQSVAQAGIKELDLGRRGHGGSV